VSGDAVGHTGREEAGRAVATAAGQRGGRQPCGALIASPGARDWCWPRPTPLPTAPGRVGRGPLAPGSQAELIARRPPVRDRAGPVMPAARRASPDRAAQTDRPRPQRPGRRGCRACRRQTGPPPPRRCRPRRPRWTRRRPPARPARSRRGWWKARAGDQRHDRGRGSVPSGTAGHHDPVITEETSRLDPVQAAGGRSWHVRRRSAGAVHSRSRRTRRCGLAG